MYYSQGNYEAFAKPKKQEGIETKKAHIIGGGLAGLATAAFLIRDAQMPCKNIKIYESSKILGGACDGIEDPIKKFVFRGGREMENHFECLWDLYRSIPSLKDKNVSVLDEFYWLNKEDPNYSLMRSTKNKGSQSADDGKDYGLSKKAIKQIIKLATISEKKLEDKKISDIFGDSFFESNFWMFWRTMFAFQEWSSALEMKRYVLRFIHHIGGIHNFSVLKFTRYNQYESLILPLVEWLKQNGVQYTYNAKITNVIIEKFNNINAQNKPIDNGDKKIAKTIELMLDGKKTSIKLTGEDFVFITNGSCTENSSLGDHKHAAVINDGPGDSWEMWKNIAKQSNDFGNPLNYCTNIKETKWESASVYIRNKEVIKQIEKITKRDPLSGRVCSGGIVTVRDSNWLMSWCCNRQPQFQSQPKGTVMVWLDGLFTETNGDYIKKPMEQCNGEEIAKEWLYHIGIPTKLIDEYAKEESVHVIPCMMPYINAFFQPRKKTDRPLVVPEGSINFAFIGQFAETERDCIFTTEYSVRTAMESVYKLLNVDRGVPEVFCSCFDVRWIFNSANVLTNGKVLKQLPIIGEFAAKKFINRKKDTIIGELAEEFGIIKK